MPRLSRSTGWHLKMQKTNLISTTMIILTPISSFFEGWQKQKEKKWIMCWIESFSKCKFAFGLYVEISALFLWQTFRGPNASQHRPRSMHNYGIAALANHHGLYMIFVISLHLLQVEYPGLAISSGRWGALEIFTIIIMLWNVPYTWQPGHCLAPASAVS